MQSMRYIIIYTIRFVYSKCPLIVPSQAYFPNRFVCLLYLANLAHRCSIQSLLLLLEQTSCSIKSWYITFSENGNAAIINLRFDVFTYTNRMRPTGSDSNAVLGSEIANS